MMQSPVTTTLDQVESALKTRVADILRETIPGFAAWDRGAVYNSVLNSPELLHETFNLLRKRPDVFAPVMVDDHGQAVAADDAALLSCGETLGKVKTLILRACARRFFRRNLGGPRIVAVRPCRQIGQLRRFAEWLGLAEAPPFRRKRVPGKGDILYHALKDFLIYDWQARLLPDYAKLSPAMAEAVGSGLLRVREPNELSYMRGEWGRGAHNSAKKPLFMREAFSLMSTSGDTIDSELLWRLWDQMEIERLFGPIGAVEARRIMADVAVTARPPIDRLLPVIGADVRLFITFLFVAYRKLGRLGYRTVFHEFGNRARLVEVYAGRLRRLEALPPPALAEMAEAFDAILADVEPDMMQERDR